MGKTYRQWNPNQQYLLPPSIQDWLPENDLVYFILDTVNELDISSITQKYEQEKRGFPPYNPRMMVSLLLYSYCRGVFSSRKIMQACQERISLKVIVGDDVPDFRTISDFRKLHLKELQQLFVQVLRLCQQAGLVKLGHIALDGTKVKANASRHKAMSYGRMLTEEKRLEQEIKGLLDKAQTIDDREDNEYGKDRRGDELPEELGRRSSRLRRIRDAKKALEAKAKAASQQAEQQRKQADSANEGKTKRGRKRKAVSDIPADNKQYNFTDPESGIMKANNKGWDQCGNAQAAVDSKEQIIVACDVTGESNDRQQFEPMFEQAQDNVGKDKRIRAASADNGYYSESNVKFAENNNIDVYIATKRDKHNEPASKAPRGRMPKDLTILEKMARKLRTRKGRETYSKRKSVVEPVFGQIKGARGFVQFSLRGLEKMRGEWAIVCLTHNLLKLFRVQCAVTA